MENAPKAMGVMDNAPQAPGMLRLGDDRDIMAMFYELEKEDVMKLKPLIEAMHGFLLEEGYSHPQSGDDKIEDLYWERWTPSGAKEQHIWWRLKRDVNPYVRHFIVINFQTLNVSKAEVAYKNKKVSAEKIDLIIRVWCYLQWDYNDLFKNSIAWQFRNVFFRKIYRDEIKQKRAALEKFGLRLNRLIKYYFEMIGDSENPVLFQPPMGYKEP